MLLTSPGESVQVGSGPPSRRPSDLMRRTAHPDRPTCWPAAGGCRTRPAGRPAGLGRARPPRSSERRAPGGEAGPRAASHARGPRPHRRESAPSATRYFTLPSNSPTTPSQPKSTKPTRPAASRISFCSSGFGQVEQEHLDARQALARAHAQRVGQRPHKTRGVAATNAGRHGIHLGHQLVGRAEPVAQGVVGRGDGRVEGAGSSQVDDGPRRCSSRRIAPSSHRVRLAAHVRADER